MVVNLSVFPALANIAGVAFLIAIAPHPAASGAPIEWEIREAHHPALGPIHFAFTRTPLTTRVGISQVSSQVYVSCERATGRIAIELANAQAPGDPRGLPPRSLLNQL